MNTKRLALPLTLAVLSVAAIITAVLWPRTIVSNGDYPYYESVEAAAGRADLVIVGQVQNTATRRDTVASLVVTDASVKVVETIKGSGIPEVITVQQMGGTLGNVRYLEEGATPFAKGQQLFLFLARMPNGKYMALNPFQGSLVVDPSDMVKFNGNQVSITTMKARARDAADTRTPIQRKEAGD